MSGEFKDQTEESPFIGDSAKISAAENKENTNEVKHESKETSCGFLKENEESQFLRESNAKVTEKQNEEKRQLDDNTDITCGFWKLKGPRLQSLATETVYVVLFGITGCFIAMTFAYFNGTITTLEKRYKIPTRTTGVITVGNDISSTLSSGFLGYYAGNGHRPRWIGFGLFIMSVFCLLMATPHFIYGAGEEALQLTSEFVNRGVLNATQEDHTLCNSDQPSCLEEPSVWVPIFLLFLAQFISGIGCSLFFILGLSYMDDNSTKSKTPAMLSWSAFLRMLGPSLGYTLASVCLRLYIDPDLKPLITNEDTRWMGAWWLGWLILTVIMLLSALLMYMFPKELPSAKMRRLKAKSDSKDEPQPIELSLKDMMQAVKRLGANKVFVYSTVASIFYLFGYTPYWIFTPKYIETQYQQSASTATMATGTVALAFSAAGVLLSGYVISRYRPSARTMAAWNGITDVLTAAGIVCYVFIGCDDSDKATALTPSTDSCSSSCHCEYVHYAPICSPANVTYISACHAGCSNKTKNELGQFIYSGCKCIPALDIANATGSQSATQGPCPVDCYNQFLIFLAVMCFLKFVGASGRSSSLLLVLRCVSPEDKSFSLGFGSAIVSIISFIPSPIIFGWILDNHCLVWGKTCDSKGNCWIYDTKSLRYSMNLLAAACIFFGSFFNIGVWYHAKDLQIFDSEEDERSNKDKSQLDLSEKPKGLSQS